MTDDLASRAQAFLFMEGGVLTLRKLAEFLGTDAAGTHRALDELGERMSGSGLTLICTDEQAALAVSPEVSPAIEKAYEGELSREIGEAGLEVLAIILYRGPSTRAQIDYIRGVNTSSTIRTLLSRGLVERTGNPDDAREYLYKPTAELLAHLGAQSRESLPEYTAIKDELAAFERTQASEENHGDAAGE